MKKKIEVSEMSDAIGREIERRNYIFAESSKVHSFMKRLLREANYQISNQNNSPLNYFNNCKEDYLTVLKQLVSVYNFISLCLIKIDFVASYLKYNTSERELAIWKAMLIFWVDGTDIKLTFGKDEVTVAQQQKETLESLQKNIDDSEREYRESLN